LGFIKHHAVTLARVRLLKVRLGTDQVAGKASEDVTVALGKVCFRAGTCKIYWDEHASNDSDYPTKPTYHPPIDYLSNSKSDRDEVHDNRGHPGPTSPHNDSRTKSKA